MRQISLAALLFAVAPIAGQAGTLSLFASGEELATEGFQSPKLTGDGWELEFTRVIATFDQITAWQTDPPFMADGAEIVGSALSLGGPFTVDLVAADDEDRVVLTTVDAPLGHYNALSWALVPATDGAFAGYSLVFEGTARKDDREIAFTLRSSDAVMHACGEYLGDERKGFVTEEHPADLEITLHLDHLFGRADKPADDPMNRDALGFDTFASGGLRDFSLSGLHLGHVGEGHCHDSAL